MFFQYSFVGYLWQVYSTQTFEVSGMPGMTMSGTYFLDNGFDLRDVDSWAMFGVLLAWIAFFRFTHYAAFAFEVYPYLVKPYSGNTKPDVKREIELFSA